jgi:hypothetical protein
MEEIQKRPVPLVFSAMAAMDQAVAAHRMLAERLAAAFDEAGRFDEALRRADPADEPALTEAARKLGLAVGLVQKLASLEERARLEVRRAQTALNDVRRTDHRGRVERLRVELEIDAASIWDLVGQFEAQMRTRLDQHAGIAAELAFSAQAAGEPGLAAPEASTWTRALGTSGPELLDALATGVRQLQQAGTTMVRTATPVARIEPDAGMKVVLGKRIEKPAPPRSAPRPPAPPAEPPPFRFGVDVAPPKQSPAPRPVVKAPPVEPPPGRIGRALSALGRVLDSRPAPPRKSVR